MAKEIVKAVEQSGDWPTDDELETDFFERCERASAADQIPRADVAVVLTELRDALAADKAYGAVGRLQAAMYQLGVEYAA